MKIATYNVWHGLNGEGILRFGELEPAGRKERRMAVQLRELKRLEADVLFLQEVNPVISGGRRYGEALGLENVHQIDQAGIEIFGYGFPTNLKTGLCTLVNSDFKIVKIAGPRLSGGFGWLSDHFSLQLKEFRYALFARVKIEGLSVLTVNLHLHHGPAMTASSEARLEELVATGVVGRDLAESTRASMSAAVERRKLEMDRVLIGIRRFRREGDEIIVAGDFNGWGADLEPFERNGIVNVTERKLSRPSWDGPSNRENHAMSRWIASPFPDYGNPALLEFIRQTIDEPRMLDHILLSESLAKRVASAVRILDEPVDGLLGSDHFGIAVTLR